MLFPRLNGVNVKLLCVILVVIAFLVFSQSFRYPYGNRSMVFHVVDSSTFPNSSNPANFDIVVNQMLRNESVSEIDEGAAIEQDESNFTPSDDVKETNALSGMDERELGTSEQTDTSRKVNAEHGSNMVTRDISLTSNSNMMGLSGKTELIDQRIATSISQMNPLLLKNSDQIKELRPRWSSPRDKELQRARYQIENAPVIRNVSEVLASLFRNYSMFIRSYELMERTLKVYVYKEGEKPIFHQPYLRGIYASEGWFMKLMERNRQFLVKDPQKAHLFYLPFSSLKQRGMLNKPGFTSQKDLENHLKSYVGMVAKKYRFWNRTRGADHFLVACHDWAPRFTRNLESCIRVLCNSNTANGFTIGKDISLPVTYIRSGENPVKDVGGNPPSERPILAFFAGGMHGHVRPVLLQHWQNKEPDMKILGPMPRDIEGKARYREFMKTSKYCICAKGYEVHTPRVVESIYYECIPVIISDNYVPPLFEFFDWESFALFVSEKDIPKLRDVLLSVSEEKYRFMHERLKVVQEYFVWHKDPVKYDLFHMILHSVWYNRVFRARPG